MTFEKLPSMDRIQRVTSIMTKRVQTSSNNVDRDGVVSYARVTPNIMFPTKKQQLKVPVIGSRNRVESLADSLVCYRRA